MTFRSEMRDMTQRWEWDLLQIVCCDFMLIAFKENELKLFMSTSGFKLALQTESCSLNRMVPF